MISNLFISDKAPFVVTLALGVLGWFVTTTISNISEVVVLGVSRVEKDKSAIYTVSNNSIKRSLSNAVFILNCRDNDCLSEMEGGAYIVQENVPPYAIQGSQICAKGNDSATVLLSLPPGGVVRYQIRSKGSIYPTVVFIGITKGGCPDSLGRLESESIWIFEGCSLLLLFAKYYLHVLTFAFLVTLGVLGFILLHRRNDQGPAKDAAGEQT